VAVSGCLLNAEMHIFQAFPPLAPSDTVLGKNRMASGREEALKACAVSFGSNQEGSVLLAVLLRSRFSSTRLSALPTPV